MTWLRVRMLGAFELARGDDRVPARAWRTRHALALVKLLLAERGSVVAADRLADLLWPESDPAAARHSLQVAVRTARVVLEPDLRSGAASRFILTEGRGYRFSTDACSIDADELTAAHRTGRAAERAGDARAAIDAYRAAVSLYRGAYLEEDGAEEWALATRERLRELFIDSAQRLAGLLATAGGTDEAIATIERAIGADPLREELYLTLMRVHLAAGHRSHALAVHDRCARVLRSELASAPGPELDRLRELARGDTATATARRVAPELRLPFVGRATELSRLADAWGRSQREGGVIALVEGAAGEGKTRLVRQLADSILPRSRVLWITGHESERDLPYAPLRALLSAWLERGEGPAAVQRLGHHAGILAVLLPEIRDLWPDVPLPEERADETAQAEAFTRAIRLMKGPSDALLVLDDLHWMDAATARWLGYAIRRDLSGLLIVATRRPADGGSDPLDPLIGDLRRHERSITVRVGPLSRVDLEQLAAPLVPAPAGAAVLAARLQDATGGNALFAVETLRELWSRGPEARPDDLPIPATLRETIGARAGRLAGTSRQALLALAVLDAPAVAEAVAMTAALSRERTVDALEELLRAALVRTTDDGQRYEIAHPIVAATMYESLSPEARATLHRSAAEVAGLRPAVRVRHLERAALPAAELAHEAEAAGIAASASGRLADAVACLESALRARATLPPDDHARVRLAERLADALHAVGRWSDAVATCRAALTYVDDPLARSRLLRRAATSLGDVDGQFADALKALDEASRALGDERGAAADTERALVAVARTLAHFYRSEYPQVIEHGERALGQLRREVTLARERVDVLERIGAAHQRLGHLDAAEAAFREAEAAAGAAGDALLEARVRDQLALALIHRGRLAEARDLIEGALAVYRGAGSAKFEGRALVNLGWASTQLGALSAARDAYAEAIARSEPLGARYTVMHALVGIGQVVARLGGFARARADLERGIRLAEEMGTRQRVAHGLAHLAELALLEGDAARAQELVARARAVADAIGDAHTVRECQVTLARALIALGDPRAAAAAAREGVARSQASGSVLGEARGRIALAEAEAAGGDAAAAVAGLVPTVALLRETGAAHDLAQALGALATVLPGAPGRAALAEATALARSCGARPLVRTLEARATPAS